MTFKLKMIAVISLATVLLQPIAAMAQAPAKHVPAKAPTPAAPQTATPVVNHGFLVEPPKKPRVITAVAPKPMGPGPKKGIIFVGGKPSPGSKAALNPQPIPPGRGGPGDPIR